MLELNKVYNENCLTGMQGIADGSQRYFPKETGEGTVITEKNCETCKYEDFDSISDPCDYCDDSNEWRSKQEDMDTECSLKSINDKLNAIMEHFGVAGGNV